MDYCVQLLLIFVCIFSLGDVRIISESTKQLLRDNKRIEWSYDYYYVDYDDDYFGDYYSDYYDDYFGDEYYNDDDDYF